MMKLLYPKAVLFDWDNTLVDSWPIIHESWNHTLKTMGQPTWDIATTKERVHRSLRDVFPELFGQENWQKARDIYYEKFLQIHLDNLRMLQDAQSVLQALNDENIYVGIVSNKTGTYLRKEIERLGWNPYFKIALGATDTPKDKPDRIAVDAALAQSGFSQDAEKNWGRDVWFIGDSPSDLACALNSGAQPILFGEPGMAEEHRKTLANYPHFTHDVPHFKTHQDLLQAIKSLPKSKSST